ncbi:PREDICTED: uncharacterized protein LOC105556019 [Vollenhovia emeryi]|uniref:uncharacterized protein LOC105556019 n=1 Tax=Vollenhovia emeryi TaxID=411798 RepID=UPI0005F39DB9|nr:PREDICTED: uncharacterized protein LOC105556019 [Vollenhovia emeryi]
MTEKKYSIVEFEDGVQIIPNNWFTADLKQAYWPHYTTNQRYDTAVKLMEPPKSTWLKHPVNKIFRTFSCYEKARKKLKDVEDLSDINSCTETEAYLKKSRKIRAAKVVTDSSSNSSDEFSEADQIFKDIPKVPKKEKTTTHTKIKTVMKNGNANVSCAKEKQVKINKNKYVMEDFEPGSKKIINEDPHMINHSARSF